MTGNLYAYSSATPLIGKYDVSGNSFRGGIGEIAVFNYAVGSGSNFTPPSSEYTGTETGLICLYRLAGDATDSAGQPLVQQYGYDEVGNRNLLVDPDGGRFTTTFDTLNRTYVTQDPDNNLTTLQYDADLRRTTLIDANGATRKYQYDLAGRLDHADRAGSHQRADHHHRGHVRSRWEPDRAHKGRRSHDLEL